MRTTITFFWPPIIFIYRDILLGLKGYNIMNFSSVMGSVKWIHASLIEILSNSVQGQVNRICWEMIIIVTIATGRNKSSHPNDVGCDSQRTYFNAEGTFLWRCSHLVRFHPLGRLFSDGYSNDVVEIYDPMQWGFSLWLALLFISILFCVFYQGTWKPKKKWSCWVSYG